MTKYTDDQINEAIMLANQTGKVYVWEIEMYRNVIKHLPEPQHDWQECGFEDIREGDRVRLVCKPGPLEVSASVVEVEPLVVQNHYITWARGNNLGVIESSDVQAVYRIPAAVQHPDPAQHPVIIVHKTGTVIWDERPAYWNPEEREYVFHDAFCTAFLPDDITEWEPAKVVAEDDR